MSAIAQLAPEVPISLPKGKPNTGPAIAAIAKAIRHDAAKGHRFKDSVYRAFWVDGTDISSDEELEKLAARAALPPLVELPAVDELVQGWARSWMGLGTGGVPLLLHQNGRGLVGLTSMAQLGRFFDRKVPGQ